MASSGVVSAESTLRFECCRVRKTTAVNENTTPMSQSSDHDQPTHTQLTELTEEFIEFYSRYYHDEIGKLAQRFPNEQKSLYVNYNDLFRYDPELAEDFREDPEQVGEYAEQALGQYDLPVDLPLQNAHVRIHNHPTDHTFYPGHFPDDLHEIAGTHVAVEGQIERATEKFSKITEAAFECERCGTMSYIPQEGSGFQEPHECQGCERQGPFTVIFDDSEFVDAQRLRIAEPPEIAKSGDGAHIDVEVEDDIVNQTEPGDKVVISGILHLEQQSKNKSKTVRFNPYLEARAITTKEAEFEDIEITDEDEERIHEVAENGLEDDNRDIFELATHSIAPGIVDEDNPKLSIFLQLLSGVRTSVPGGTEERGDLHQLLIGDPSTAKSQLMEAAAEIAPRSVSVSGHGASASGLTAAVVRDDFSAAEWTLEAGALVHAHNGLACIDELDKIKSEAVDSMHSALAQQRVPINKAGINTTLPSETAVLAAANPKDGRWDPYNPEHEQIDIDPALLSRFGLVWCFRDDPDESRDRKIARSMLTSKDVAKRIQFRDGEVSDKERSQVEPPLSAEFLRKYIAYARQNYYPAFRDQEVMEQMEDGYVSLRAANGYDDDAPIPVSSRKLQDVLRLAESSARARLSDNIEAEDIERAQQLIGASIQEFGTNEDGEMDVDTVETGTTKTQKERIEHLYNLILEAQPNGGGGIPMGTVINEAEEQLDLPRKKTKNTIENLREKGKVYEPQEGLLRALK